MNSLRKDSSEKSFLGYMLALLLVACASAVSAEEAPISATLVLSPKQCIALHQGQKCYVDIEISWVAQRQADYCLFSSQQQDALMCWSGQATGIFKREIVAIENVGFRLKQTGREEILSAGELEMAWVYKKNSRARSSWRMF
ncbi:MAG: hypothetical protein ACI808_003370 [Paraglaciecola sp.]|jgi:hypothetical protein